MIVNSQHPKNIIKEKKKRANLDETEKVESLYNRMLIVGWYV